METDPHIVVLCLDTLRKDAYDDHAPRLAEQASVEFEEMRAAASWSVPSHASMLTGTLPEAHGFTAYNRYLGDISREDTFLADLDGYDTFCVSANVYASDVYGFDQLFDEFVRFSPSSRFPEGMDVQEFLDDPETNGGYLPFVKTAVTHDHPVASLLNGAMLKARDVFAELPMKNPFDHGGRAIARTVRRRIGDATAPTFIFANLMDVHGPHSLFRGLDTNRFDLSKEFNSRDFDLVQMGRSEDDHADEIEALRELYAAETDYLDRLLASLIDDLQTRRDRPVRVVVTADHGENLGYPAEDGMIHHLGSLSEALLHVPFDVISDAHSGTIDGRTSLLDLGTVIDRLRTGEPLDDLVRDHVAAEIAGYGGGEIDVDADWWDRSQRAVYDGDRKYVRFQDGEECVYDVSGQPSWQMRVDEPFAGGLFERTFERTLQDWAEEAEAAARSDQVSDGVAQRLEDLGYA